MQLGEVGVQLLLGEAAVDEVEEVGGEHHHALRALLEQLGEESLEGARGAAVGLPDLGAAGEEVAVDVLDGLEGKFGGVAAEGHGLLGQHEHGARAEAVAHGGEEEGVEEVLEQVELGGGVVGGVEAAVGGKEVRVLREPGLAEVEVAPAVGHAGGEVGDEDEGVLGEEGEAAGEHLAVGDEDGEVAPVHGGEAVLEDEAGVVLGAEGIRLGELGGALHAEKGAEEPGEEVLGHEAGGGEDLPVDAAEDVPGYAGERGHA